MAIFFVPAGLGLAAVAAFAAKKLFGTPGRTVVVLGPRKAGKTTLAARLSGGSIVGDYAPTQSTVKTQPHTISMEDLKFALTTFDVSGDSSAYGEWERTARSAHLVCYLVSSPCLEFREYLDTAIRGARQLGGWDHPGHIVLVITHIDEDAEKNLDTIMGRNTVREIRDALGNPKVVPVNLTDSESARALVIQLLRELDE